MTVDLFYDTTDLIFTFSFGGLFLHPIFCCLIIKIVFTLRLAYICTWLLIYVFFWWLACHIRKKWHQIRFTMSSATIFHVIIYVTDNLKLIRVCVVTPYLILLSSSTFFIWYPYTTFRGSRVMHLNKKKTHDKFAKSILDDYGVSRAIRFSCATCSRIKLWKQWCTILYHFTSLILDNWKVF